MPRRAGRSENPKPGSDGTTTSKESAGSPPKRAGSASRGTTFIISRKEPGQPWVRTSGMGLGPVPRAWRKWMPSSGVW